MKGRNAVGRLLIGLISIALLGGCSAGASPTPASPTPTGGPSALAKPSPSIAATTAPTPTPASIVVTRNLAYEATNEVLVPGTLDVFAPATAVARPVVVMFHGAPGSDPVADRRGLDEHAHRVAELGFVVFNASWGQVPGGGGDWPTYDQLMATQSEAACAVEFARAHAARYGGDPSTMIVFGHSGGAHAATMAAFARPTPTAGCIGGTALGAIDALVTWEGNWLLSLNGPDWNGALAADPRVLDAVTPWRYLAKDKNLKVVMLVSEDPKASLESEFPGVIVDRPVGDPWAADSWLAVRDPSGDLRRQLEANGALADGKLDFVEVQQFLFSVLKAQGNPVSLDVMPSSSHAWLAGQGWGVFLAAFPKAAARD